MQRRPDRRRPLPRISQDAWQQALEEAATVCESWPPIRLDLILRRLQKVCDQALLPTGLTLQQFHLLCRIATMDSPLAADLARLLEVNDGSLSRTLGRLEKRGWIQKFNSEIGHALHLQLTENGRRCLQAGLQAVGGMLTPAGVILARDGLRFEDPSNPGQRQVDS